MSASIPMPMPASVSYSFPPNIMTAPHHFAAHPAYHQSISAGHPVNIACDPVSLSPSNVSTHSSAFPPAPSTAATSPNSNFIINQAPGFAPYQQNPHATTRILQLSDFNKDLKTRDIQLVFAEWEDDRGGFKIKWIDDTSCLIVFADPAVAKRAFLSVLSNPPPSLTSPGQAGQQIAKLRAYNGPDVVHILAAVQNRPRSRSNASQSLHSRASSMASMSGGPGGLGRRPSMGALAARNRASISSASGRPPPANPIVQAQVQELIDHVTTAHTAAAAGVGNGDLDSIHSNNGPPMRPRIEDAGKRFIAAGLGKPSSAIPGLDDGISAASYSLANLTIEEEVLTPTTASH